MRLCSQDLLKLPDNAFIKDIEKDLGRTFPHHELFVGSTSQGCVREGEHVSRVCEGGGAHLKGVWGRGSTSQGCVGEGEHVSRVCGGGGARLKGVWGRGSTSQGCVREGEHVSRVCEGGGARLKGV